MITYIILFLLLGSLLLLPKYNIKIAWIYVFLISDPGGISSTYLDKGILPGGIFFIDILGLLILIALITGPFKIRRFFRDKTASSIFYVLLLFVLYKVFVWGLIVPPDKDSHDFFRYTLIRERDSILGFLIIIPVYLFALKDLKKFLYVIIVFGFVILIASGLSIIFGLELVKTVALERYSGSGMTRHILIWYGLLNILIPASIVVFIVRIPIKYKQLLLFGGIMAIINIIIALTKNLYLYLIGTIFASIYFSVRIFNTRGSQVFSGILVYSMLLTIVISVAFPKYLGFSSMVVKDIYLLATTGKTSDGSTSRAWQIEALLYETAKHPILGTGQGYEQLDTRQFDVNQFDATDLPLLAHIMQYGVVGILIYLMYYFKLFKLIRKLYIRFRTMKSYEIINNYRYEFIFAIASISYFAGYFLKGYTIFIELTRGINRIEMSIYTALLLAVLQRIRQKLILANAYKSEHMQ